MDQPFEETFSLLREISSGEETVPAHVPLIDMNQENEQLILLHEGSIRVGTRSGESIIQEAPNILGEISFVAGGLATANVETASEAVISRISFKQLNTLKSDGPAFHRIYSSLTRLCIQRLSGAYHHRYIALVAHDSRKEDLIQLVNSHREFFEQHNLVSTENTGLKITEETGLKVARRVRTGVLGGDQQIGALVSEGLISAVVFLRDPLWAQPHSADVNALIRICELENVPLATNLASAEAILRHESAI
ncbi:MAG: methylglyoxal synthase [Planctomycetota bacterium]